MKSPDAKLSIAMIVAKLAEAETIARAYVHDPFDRARLKECADVIAVCSEEVAVELCGVEKDG